MEWEPTWAILTAIASGAGLAKALSDIIRTWISYKAAMDKVKGEDGYLLREF